MWMSGLAHVALLKIREASLRDARSPVYPDQANDSVDISPMRWSLRGDVGIVIGRVLVLAGIFSNGHRGNL